MSRASKCSPPEPASSGGRKYASPVLPPRLTARPPARSKRFLRTTMLSDAALHLDARRVLLFRVSQRVALEHPAPAAHHVDAGPAGPPAFEDALLDAEVREARQLDAVVVARGTHVRHAQTREQHVVGGSLGRAPVVEVDAVARRAPEGEVAQLDVGGVGQLDAGGAADEHGRPRGIGAGEHDGLALRPESPDVGSRRPGTRRARRGCASPASRRGAPCAGRPASRTRTVARRPASRRDPRRTDPRRRRRSRRRPRRRGPRRPRGRDALIRAPPGSRERAFAAPPRPSRCGDGRG